MGFIRFGFVIWACGFQNLGSIGLRVKRGSFSATKAADSIAHSHTGPGISRGDGPPLHPKSSTLNPKSILNPTP